MITEKKLRLSRIAYIAQAAVEYFISLLVTTSFLATLTSSLGISDSVTGVISSFISLGYLFQLLTVFLKRPRAKGIVVTFSVLNQLLFLFLYVTPLLPLSQGVKTGIFIVSILGAYVLFNAVVPQKVNWLNSLVEDSRRGDFTAWKEIVSLISGMIFTYVMGSLIDYYRDKGELQTAFIICAIVVFVLTVLHTVILLVTAEPETGSGRKVPLRQMFGTLKNPTVLKLGLLMVLWNMALHSSTDFYGTYLIKELGFSLKFVSVLSIIYSVVRASVSVSLGRYADRTSFARMFRLSLLIMAGGFLINIFTVPSNGRIFYTVYYVLYAIAMAGISSASLNLVFDYVPIDQRADAFAMFNALSGLAGFLTTLVVSGLVVHIQEGGNKLFGISLYAQQAVSVLGFALTLLTVLYLTKVILPLRNQRRSS